ncbi:hypothetical protein R4P64_32085 [Rhodococcus sp. IEGM 1366]|uniref:hypothetical protein n=1 Tax=Rhodococcus sp. IEGM 1366 TaxID=3082223 RepID=UPI0029541769|nr:hypothetical protein [Rhodococcus sp. IEGM 1366]MDV8071159.1 hypothetical protein [Rhodococcus sp. IEGM 1366]
MDPPWNLTAWVVLEWFEVVLAKGRDGLCLVDHVSGASIAAAVSLINVVVAWRDLGTADETSTQPRLLVSGVWNEWLEPRRAHQLYRQFWMHGLTGTECTQTALGNLAQPRFDF